MKIKVLFLALVLVLAVYNVKSQEIIYANDENQVKYDQAEETLDPVKQNKKESKISYNIELGTSFITSKNFGNALEFYTKPSLRYKLSPKFNITAGIMLINTNIGSYYLSENQNKRNYKAYLMSGFNYTKERLKINGEILYGMNKSTYNSYNKKYSPEYYARFSAEYKITDGFSIGLQIISQNMNSGFDSPYGYQFNNPYNRYNMFSGF
jgi:hypothetical protein